MILKRAVELSRGQPSEISAGFLAEKLNRYASLLAAQGSIDTAMKYVGNANEVSIETYDNTCIFILKLHFQIFLMVHM